MALDVQVNISTASPIGEIGFGIPLIIESMATAAVSYRECSSLQEVSTACGNLSKTYKAAQLLFKQEHAPSKIAVCSGTGTAVETLASVIDKNWRQLIVIFGADDTTANDDISQEIEDTDDKMFYMSASTIGDISNIAGGTRTVAFFYDRNEELNQDFAAAALVGETAGRPAGSFTYKNIKLRGIEPLEKTDTEIDNIHSAGGFTVVKKAGDVVTTEGKNAFGEYIDVIDSKDWIIQQIEYQAQKLLNNSDKLPYTDAGIAALESVVRNVLQDAFSRGMIATDSDNITPMYSVAFKKRAEMSTSDRSNRIYSGGNFTFTLAGAIHTATINGELVV